jgi:hypothetical protein
MCLHFPSAYEYWKNIENSLVAYSVNVMLCSVAAYDAL